MAPPAQRGARRQIEGEAHVWTGSGWERVAKLERRLQKLHGLIRYNDEMTAWRRIERIGSSIAVAATTLFVLHMMVRVFTAGGV
jgi:hypothetical protein